MIAHFGEVILVTAMALLTVTTAGVTAAPTSEEIRTAVFWSVMPFVGSMLSSAMAFFLGTQAVDRRQAFGRCLGSLLFGVCGPRFMLHLRPELQEMVKDPILLIAGGSFFGLLGYALSSKAVNYALTRGPKVLENKLNKLTKDENNRDGDGAGA